MYNLKMNKLSLHDSLSVKEKLRLTSNNINLINERNIILELRKDCRLWLFIRICFDILEDPVDASFRKLKSILNI